MSQTMILEFQSSATKYYSHKDDINSNIRIEVIAHNIQHHHHHQQQAMITSKLISTSILIVVLTQPGHLQHPLHPLHPLHLLYVRGDRQVSNYPDSQYALLVRFGIELPQYVVVYPTLHVDHTLEQYILKDLRGNMTYDQTCDQSTTLFYDDMIIVIVCQLCQI